jgi:hypothetical protein
MAKLRKEIILKGKSESDVEEQINDWVRETAGKVCDVDVGPVVPIEDPLAPEHRRALQGMTRCQATIKYTLKPNE